MYFQATGKQKTSLKIILVTRILRYATVTHQPNFHVELPKRYVLIYRGQARLGGTVGGSVVQLVPQLIGQERVGDEPRHPTALLSSEIGCLASRYVTNGLNPFVIFIFYHFYYIPISLITLLLSITLKSYPLRLNIFNFIMFVLSQLVKSLF